MKPSRVSSHDANHYIPRDFLRDRCGGFMTHKIDGTVAYSANYQGHSILLIDTSKYGGVIVDWHIECNETQRAAWLEVKTPKAFLVEGHSMKPGEKFMFENSALFRFIMDEEDFIDTLYWLIVSRET
jgi:hypothetical protein